MAFRFQKRIKILPGVTINLSKGGVSTSIGTRGARMTFGRGKTRATVGVPGTGLSYTSITPMRSPGETAPPRGPGALIGLIVVILFVLWLFF